MPKPTETIAHCHACGSPMNVAAVAPFSNVECPTCGEHTRVKREFGPYTLVRRHAVGGMSMVFVAQDKTLGREVALKILSEDFSADERRIAAFEEEARITASFSHPNVVRVLTTGKAFDRFYIAMELVPGGHFEHQIRERGKIPELEMLPLAIEVAQGLKAAHSAGLIHRDVKPGNILLDAEGHAKLVDFGLALVTQGGKAQAAELWATPYYVPPETIEGFPEDFRSDIYAFGATLYHALAGRPSCGQETMVTDALREAKKHITPLGEAEPQLSVEVCRIVDKAMAYDPSERFASYDELISRLESALKRLSSGQAGKVETHASVARRRAKKRRSELVVLSVSGLALLGAIAGGVWWITRDSSPPVATISEPTEVAPVLPESPPATATDIAKNYREARAAVESGEFNKAAAGFVKLRENPSVQEPTRTWAAVEAVVAWYLAGSSGEARKEAKAALEHIASLDGGAPQVGEALEGVLEELGRLPAIPATDIKASETGPARVIAWMLAGLKNWEQGMLDEAAKCFSAVATSKTTGDEQWLGLYQKLAQTYLADREALSAGVFKALPPTVADCKVAVAELDEILKRLGTRSRAKYNVRAWQLDIARHAKLLASQTAVPPEPTAPAWNPAEVMAKVESLSKECRFIEATALLKSFSDAPPDATRDSLLALTESASAFLVDLEKDLAAQPASGEFALESGEIVRTITAEKAGELVVTDGEMQRRPAEWREFTAEALIGLHRMLVKNLDNETERLRRHESAISYSWLAGGREHALAAAAALAQTSPEFKQRWEAIASGLPQ
ncbi:MAG: serine/threonine-protein kinase [Luteolibacter sp.]